MYNKVCLRYEYGADVIVSRPFNAMSYGDGTLASSLMDKKLQKPRINYNTWITRSVA